MSQQPPKHGDLGGAEEQYRLLTECVTDYAVLFLDPAGRVATWNAGAERFFGYREAEIVGRPADVFFTPEDLARGVPAKELRTAAAHGRANDDRWLVRKGGTRLWVTGSLSALRDDGGGLRGYAKVVRDRTRDKEAEGAMARDALLLANVHDSVIVIDLEGVVTYWNEGATRLFGWTAAEMLGRPSTDRVPPEARPAMAERQAALRADDEFTGEWLDYRKDGSRVWIEARVTPLRDRAGQPIGFLGLAHDVTERKKVADALRQSEERFRELFENAADAVYTIDLQGNFTSGNAAAERLTGYSLDELMRMKIPDLLSPEQLERAVKMLEAKLTGGSRTVYELELLTKDGRRRYVQISSRLIIRDGQPVGVQGIAHDLTEMRQRAADLADENRRKDEFLAMLGHELRNPLAPIRNAVEVLRRNHSGEAGDWAAGVIDRQVRQLTRLVDDLLDMSRITRGMVKLQREAVDVGRVVADAVETCLPQIDARRQHLDLSVQPNLGTEGDHLRLAQVVGNVLTNASKYTGEEGHIWLSAVREGGEVVLRVRDDGIGIRADMLPRVFDLFIQAEPAFHQSLGGLGIGLTLVKRVVEMHGGTVAAHSAGPDQGSEFVIRLPARTATPVAPGPGTPAAPVASVCGRRVLVVDDNIDHAETLGLILRLEGHEVQAVTEGSAVLEVARVFRPDAVILDIGLPGTLSGYDVARQLRTLEGQEAMILVALTGYGQEEDRRRSDEAGFDYHVVKPADPEALQELIGKGRCDTRNSSV